MVRSRLEKENRNKKLFMKTIILDSRERIVDNFSWLEYMIDFELLDVEKDIGKYICIVYIDIDGLYSFYYGLLIYKNSINNTNINIISNFEHLAIISHTLTEDTFEKEQLNDIGYSYTYYWYSQKAKDKNEWLDPLWRKKVELMVFI